MDPTVERWLATHGIEDVKRAHSAARKRAGTHRRGTFQLRDARVLDFVEARANMPWEKRLVMWNAQYPDDKLNTGPGLMLRYKRAVERRDELHEDGRRHEMNETQEARLAKTAATIANALVHKDTVRARDLIENVLSAEEAVVMARYMRMAATLLDLSAQKRGITDPKSVSLYDPASTSTR